MEGEVLKLNALIASLSGNLSSLTGGLSSLSIDLYNFHRSKQEIIDDGHSEPKRQKRK